MDHTICPGSKFLRQPKPEIFSCSKCGGEVEIWSDEIKGTCPQCQKNVFKDGMMSCLDWCKHGEDCVGDEVYKKFTENKVVGVKNRLLNKIEEYFGNDKIRIEHAKNVLNFAEELLKKEEGDWHIIIPASLLHDVGIKVAEEKYGSVAGNYQEKEGPGIAKKILSSIGYDPIAIGEIGEIIAHHHSPGIINTNNFQILFDADCLVNIQDSSPNKTKESIEKVISKMFLTATGKEIAARTFL